MKTYFVLNRFGLMIGAVLVMASVAFAAGDPTKAFFGWNLGTIELVLGIAAPFLTSFFAKSEWVTEHKQWLFLGVSLALTIVGAIFLKVFTRADLTPDTITDTIKTIISVGFIGYVLFSNKFSSLTANVGNGAKKN